MNKYVEYAVKIEEKSREKRKILSKDLFIEALKASNKASYGEELDWEKELLSTLTYISTCNEQGLEVLLPIIKEFKVSSPDTLILLISRYIKADALEQQKCMNAIGESLKILNLCQGVIKIGNFGRYNSYKLITNSKKEVSFTSYTNDIQTMKKNNSYCHTRTEEYLLSSSNNNIRGITCIMENCFTGLTRFHSFIQEDKQAIDISQNFTMAYKDYITLFKPQIISSFTKEEFIDNVNYLKEADQDFNECDYQPLLKCAFSKRI